MKMRNKLCLGARGEDAVIIFLQKKGWEILGKNVRVPFGEIDILAKHQGTLIIVEVKTRKKEASLESCMSYTKSQKILRSSQYIAQRYNTEDIRIDVAYVHAKEASFRIYYLVNAINETYCYN